MSSRWRVLESGSSRPDSRSLPIPESADEFATVDEAAIFLSQSPLCSEWTHLAVFHVEWYRVSPSNQGAGVGVGAISLKTAAPSLGFFTFHN